MEKNELAASLDFWLSLSFISTLLTPLIGLIRYAKLSKFQRHVLNLAILILVNETVTYFMREFEWNNMWVFHLFNPLLVYLILMIYREVLEKFKVKAFKVTVVLYLAFSAVNTFLIQGINNLNTNAIVSSGVLFIILSIMCFYQFLSDKVVSSRGKVAVIWFNSGVLLHYSATLILFFFVNNILTGRSDFLMLTWKLNVLLTVLLHICYSVSLWVKQKD